MTLENSWRTANCPRCNILLSLATAIHAAAVSSPPCVHTEDWHARRAAVFSRLKATQISSWQEPTPKKKPKEHNVFIGNSIGSLTSVLDLRESLKAALPFQAETQLSATVLSGGSGVSRLHRTSLVYMCTATWMTSQGAARCCFACGSALGLPLRRAPGLQPLPAFVRLACSAPSPAELSPGQVYARLPQNRVHVPSSSVFSLRLLCRDGSAAFGLLRDKVLSGAGCCSVQGTPSSSPTLPPLPLSLLSKHSSELTMETCLRFLPAPPWEVQLRSRLLIEGAVDSRCCAWASAGGCCFT